LAAPLRGQVLSTGDRVGTEIHLELGGLSLDWAKNHRGTDHGSLFQERDRRAVRSDQIDYDHFKETGDDLTPMEMAFVRKLKDVLPRLELLGYTKNKRAQNTTIWSQSIWAIWKLSPNLTSPRR
jgi:hypothetical protein